MALNKYIETKNTAEIIKTDIGSEKIISLLVPTIIKITRKKPHFITVFFDFSITGIIFLWRKKRLIIKGKTIRVNNIFSIEIGLIKLSPSNSNSISGVIIIAAKYNPKTPVTEKLLSPFNIAEKGIIEGPGGAAAININPM